MSRAFVMIGNVTLCNCGKRLFDRPGSDPNLEIKPAKGHAAFANKLCVFLTSYFHVFGSHTMSRQYDSNVITLNTGGGIFPQQAYDEIHEIVAFKFVCT